MKAIATSLLAAVLFSAVPAFAAGVDFGMFGKTFHVYDVERIGPDAVMIENVTGILSNQTGRSFSLVTVHVYFSRGGVRVAEDVATASNVGPHERIRFQTVGVSYDAIRGFDSWAVALDWLE